MMALLLAFDIFRVPLPFRVTLPLMSRIAEPPAGHAIHLEGSVVGHRPAQIFNVAIVQLERAVIGHPVERAIVETTIGLDGSAAAGCKSASADGHATLQRHDRSRIGVNRAPSIGKRARA